MDTETKEPRRSSTINLRPNKQGQMWRALPRTGRNEPCYCGSGAKYKRCHARFEQHATRYLTAEAIEQALAEG